MRQIKTKYPQKPEVDINQVIYKYLQKTKF